MITALFAAALAAADTTHYVVLNHGREAGTMTVARAGDSVVARYEHRDRNRGYASHHTYRFDKLGRPVYGQSLAWTFGGQPGAPNDRFEVIRDSVFFGVGPQPTKAA